MTARYFLRFGALGYVAFLLLVPVGLVFYRTFEHGFHPAWAAVTNPQALHALWLTLLIDAIADLPLALSPVVVGLSLYLLYGTGGWLSGFADHGIKVLFALPGMILATIFVS